ncbi:aminoglycoside phosphotransferase family protein [Nonomuraea sp. NPDC050310]|uniref:aminoglycoside phosphotransferase family protein n=1 Tax=Nonomuraea sp. NPDC050310 TaxID=3154935 RepID=UPI0033EBE137
MIDVPAELAAHHAKYAHESGPEWTAALPGLVGDFVTRWDLRVDGAAMHGVVSLVVPVLRADGTPAVLKLSPGTDENLTEGPGLRAWDGDGIVRLLAEETLPAAGPSGLGNVLLLERLTGPTLETHPDVMTATELLGGLLARLTAHPAPAGLRHLRDIAGAMLEQVPWAMERISPADRPWLDLVAGPVRELVAEPGDRLLHWDLHFDNVLAAEREPWLAIDPKPLAGDPGFDLLPALGNRWDGVADSVKRFDLLVEMLGLDRARAVGWTLGRVLQNTLWDIEDGESELNQDEFALAEALYRRG